MALTLRKCFADHHPVYFLASLFLVAPALTTCGGTPMENGDVTTVSVSGPSTVVVFQTIQLTGTVTISTGEAVSQALTWTSSASAAASVSNTGP